MNKQQLNSNIKADIPICILRNGGSYNTRDLIGYLAIKHSTTKQRISGNISFLVTQLHQHSIKTVISKKESYILNSSKKLH